MNQPSIVLSTVLLILAGPAAAQQRPTDTTQVVALEAAKTWLTENAIPLQTAEAGHGFTDLQPLKAVIGNARLVALGEATHGTREFFQLKHRMLEFLVTEMGFTVFGIEATMPEAFDVNEYVLHGTGDPGKALAGLYFWTWDTEEVLELIEWMRRYNADPTHDRKVKFYGFDMQHPTRAVKVMAHYLRQVDVEAAVTVDSAFSFLANPFTHGDFNRLPPAQKTAMATLANELLHRFNVHRTEWVGGTSTSEWAVVRQHAQILAQNLEMRSQPPTGQNVRDRFMADNIAWILDREGPAAKMVVWAHNFHVGTATWDDTEMMGVHLRRRFGVDLRIFGFAFNQGSFQAIHFAGPNLPGNLRRFRLDPAAEGSLDAVLAATGHALAAFDLRAIPAGGPVADWFAVPHVSREIGGGYSPTNAGYFLRKRHVTQLYDALFFVETMTAARANPWINIRARVRLSDPVNLDFEKGPVGDLPPGWTVSGRRKIAHYRVVTVEGGPHSGDRAAMVNRIPGPHYGETYGGLEQRVAAEPYRGKTITLKAAVRTEGGPEIQAYLWLRVRRTDGEVALYDNMADRPISTSEWREYDTTAEVPADADTIEYGLAVVGDGSAWLDSVSLAVN